MLNSKRKKLEKVVYNSIYTRIEIEVKVINILTECAWYIPSCVHS